MSSNTKIVVLRSKELIYTVILVVVAVLILAILLSIFLPPNSNSSPAADSDSQSSYVPGVYSTILSLGNSDIQLQVTVDADHINDISFVNLSETVTTMYPLVTGTLDELSAKIISAQSIENISYSTENKYTSLLLLNAVSEALSKATITTSENNDTSVIYEMQ